MLRPAAKTTYNFFIYLTFPTCFVYIETNSDWPIHNLFHGKRKKVYFISTLFLFRGNGKFSSGQKFKPKHK